MVSLQEQPEEAEILTEAWNITTGQQVANILDKAEQDLKTEECDQDNWFYSVPFAGVRCYSYSGI